MQLDYSIVPSDITPLTIWKPHDGAQTEALSRSEWEILYGGSRGGGKTDAGIVWIAEPVKHPKYRGLVIRKNATDLGDWLDRAELMYKSLGGKRVGTKFGIEFHFPSGAKIRTGHLKDESAYNKYQGHEYQRILIEELTLIPSEELYLKLVSSCRSTVDGAKPQVFCTANPGEVGHVWVKERFVDIGEPGKPVPFKDEESGFTKWRIYIPATIEDNPTLLEKDPGYLAWLNSLPLALKRAWRYGDWSVYDIRGAYYNDAVKQARAEGRIGILPYEKHLLVNTYWDLGTTALWFGQMVGLEIRWIRYMENETLDLPVIIQQMKEFGYVEWGEHVFPHDMNVRESTGRTRLETFRKTWKEVFGNDQIRTRVNPRCSDPLDGINAVHILMPRMRFDSEKCKKGIKCLENYRREWDEERQTYKSFPFKDWASHGADAMRTFGEGFHDPAMNSIEDGGLEISRRRPRLG